MTLLKVDNRLLVSLKIGFYSTKGVKNEINENNIKEKKMKIIKIIGYCFIGLGIFDFLLSWTGVDLTGFQESPLVFGVIGGVLLYLGNAKGKVADFKASLDEGEILLKSGTVSVKEGMTKQESGSLILTNRRLLYSGIGKSDGEGIDFGDVGSNDFELLLGDISSVETKFPWKIIIKDKDNNEFKLQAFGGEKWKNEILKAVSGTD